MSSINKAIIVGNLGADPEMHYTSTGSAIATVRIATSERWLDKKSGERKERTEWHRVKMFGRLGEIAGEFLTKGSKVYVEGRIETNEWEKDGVKRYTTEIVASEMKMLDSKGEKQAPAAKPVQAEVVSPEPDDFVSGDIPF